MKAAHYTNFKGPVTIEEVPDPAPPTHGVVLKVLATGLCLSDWHGWQGHDSDISLPHVPGHELAGEIVEIGRDVSNWNRGDRVTLPFVCGCGVCPTCYQGDPQVCPDQFQPGFTHWGSWAEYVSIHYADYNLVRIPEQISDVTAASLGCRFATSYRGVVEHGKIAADEYAVVFGCGGVGLSAIMIAAAYGAKVIAVDMKESALKKALEIGAHHALSSSVDIVEEIKEITEGGAHLSVDAIGHEQVVHDGISALRRRGRHVQIGLLAPTISNRAPIPMDKVIAHELSIHGSHGMAASRYPQMIELILDGKLKPEAMIDRVITLEKAVAALPIMDQYEGSGIRVVRV